MTLLSAYIVYTWNNFMTILLTIDNNKTGITTESRRYV